MGDNQRRWDKGTSFKDIVELGIAYFKDIYKEGDKINIVEVFRITSFFPIFVEEEFNENLMVPITKEELQIVVQIFQNEKIHGPNG
jgi:hypothetical protein